MPIVQVNVWSCVWCGEVAATSKCTSAWSDPVVQPPPGWKVMYGADDYTGGETCATCVPLLELQGFTEI